jgi:solute carrier family 10 (sodium/bile acid cotransporter), member 7
VQVQGYGVVQTINVCTIFVVSGLTLKTDDVVRSLKNPKGLAYGLAAILGLTPLLGFVALRIPFREDAFASGLAIFCAVPTTLSSGVALVQAVRPRPACSLL